ncbi:1,4-alpha-glucan branching protein GlgB [Aeromonas rivuli]|uniref:1,4-alpha-glucan branching protein GlgB n=1 Tax=Aeromonas rivuli TaxID=648794 RepID=UPI001CCEE9C0|nr:1,4-alpha-glucan branching protein GlgB [Aeromonas rivuli]UBO74694.1 1,4-alpha-glucan branching protein GlgB [Aeromonas rivuli]
MLVERLAAARCADPFSHLGLCANPDGPGLRLRAWLPDAIEVGVKDLKSGKLVTTLTPSDPSGLFETVFTRRKLPFPYQLIARYADASHDIIDPYQCQDAAWHGLAELTAAPEHLYQTLGAQLTTITHLGQSIAGVRFAVYAPSATAVSLIGDFNLWDGRRHPMQRSLCGHWVLFVPGMQAGARYKFELKDLAGNRLPHKSDPVGFYCEQYPSFASVVYDHEQYQWQDGDWQARCGGDKREQALSIYELHVGSWKRHPNGDSLSWRELAVDLVGYVTDMGYTHIELLPVSEHPFSGSWGYQPVGMFSPTSRFGSADDFKFFVDACHQAGIGVILDWVPAHFPSDAHGLARFDGTPLYEYEDPRRGWHPDWNSYIYDFGRDTVRQFLVASALYWLDKFHIDGLRVDAVASMLYLDYSRNAGEWVPNVDGGNHNYEAISLLKWFNEAVYGQYPNAVTIAEESTAFAGVSRPTFLGGLGFGFKWNMGWMHDTLSYMQKEPVHRRYHHNEMTFAMVYHYDENFILPLSHDEVVHGKHSLLYKMPGDEWQQAANLRAYMGYMYGHPGKKLNFMGTEIAQSSEWNHDAQLPWHLLHFPKHAGQQALIRDLNQLYRQETALFEADHERQGFRWLDHNDADNSILAWLRADLNGNGSVLVASNFTPVPRQHYRLGVPGAGRYRVLLNTDSEHYWGSNYDVGLDFVAESTPWQGMSHSIELDLPPLATLFIKQES